MHDVCVFANCYQIIKTDREGCLMVITFHSVHSLETSHKNAKSQCMVYSNVFLRHTNTENVGQFCLFLRFLRFTKDPSPELDLYCAHTVWL